MAYTNKTNVENYLQTTIPSSRDAWLTILIAAVQEWIDSYCGKSFGATSETRYYDGNGRDEIVVDDFTGTPTITLLLEDGSSDTVLDTDHYLLYPLNSTTKNTIKLKDASPYQTFAKQTKRVQVLANFGYAASVPNEIAVAATMLVAKLYNAGTADGEVQSETLGDYSVSYKSIEETAKDIGAISMLDTHRDIEI